MVAALVSPADARVWAASFWPWVSVDYEAEYKCLGDSAMTVDCEVEVETGVVSVVVTFGVSTAGEEVLPSDLVLKYGPVVVDYVRATDFADGICNPVYGSCDPGATSVEACCGPIICSRTR